MSLRFKMIVGVAIIEITFLGFLVWYGLSTLEKTENEQLLLRVDSFMRHLTNNTLEPVLTSDIAALEGLLEEYTKSEDIKYIKVYDDNNVLIAQAGDSKTASVKFTQDQLIADTQSDLVFDQAASISIVNLDVGRIEAGFSTSKMLEHLKSARKQLTIIAAIEVLFVALFSLILGNILTKRLKQLDSAAHAISSGNLSIVLDEHEKDEVGNTINAFNTMTHKLREYQAEQAFQARIMQLIRHTLDKYLLDQDIHQAFDALLKEVLLLTESEYGFIGEICKESSGDTYLKMYTFSNLNWNEELHKFYKKHAPENLEFHNQETVFAKAVQQRNYIIVNNFLESQKGFNAPAGHPSVRTFLAVPLLIGGEAVGLIGIANKKDGYSDAMVNHLDVMWQSLATLIAAHKNEILRRDLKAHIEQREKYLSTVFSSLIDVIISIDDKGIITDCNTAAENVLGYLPDELKGKNVNIIVPSPYHELHDSYIKSYVDHPRSVDSILMKTRELTAKKKNGEFIPIELTVSELRDQTGNLCFVGVISDNTERMKNIETLREARDQAQQAARAKADFLASMSHEIRTPIHGVIGLLDLVQDESLPQQERHFIDLARNSAGNLLQIVNDVLDFSKIDAGKIEVVNQEFNLRDLLEETLDVFTHQAMQKQIQLFCLIPDDIPEWVKGDITHLRQVLVNLLGNAIKFTQSGQIELNVSPLPEQQSVWRFEVTDTGIGMKPETINKLFTAFEQGETGTSRRYGGTGLGLTISKKLVELMNGVMGVHSEFGKGSTFWFTLQLPKTDRSSEYKNIYSEYAALILDENAKQASMLRSSLRSLSVGYVKISSLEEFIADNLMDINKFTRSVVFLSEAIAQSKLTFIKQKLVATLRGTACQLFLIKSSLTGAKLAVEDNLIPSLIVPITRRQILRQLGDLISPKRSETVLAKTNMRILLVEDNFVNKELAGNMLEKMGYVIDWAENGREAVDKFTANSNHYCLILMDCQMPVMDGYEATKLIREYESQNVKPSTPIIALTANVLKSDLDRCLEVGMNDVITKPFDYERLRSLIKIYLPQAA